MNRFSLLALAFATSCLLASEDSLITKGNDVSATLLQKLGGELKSHMQSEGAISALQFCSLNALTLTESIGHDSNTTLKRVSIKNRNPINAADSSEKIVLDKWDAMLKNNQPLPVYEIEQKRYYKPILINNEACLKCHGNVEGDLAKAIHATYPEDKATGYKMGDLRGMIVVEVK
jgi:hypothetical protein